MTELYMQFVLVLANIIKFIFYTIPKGIFILIKYIFKFVKAVIVAVWYILRWIIYILIYMFVPRNKKYKVKRMLGITRSMDGEIIKEV